MDEEMRKLCERVCIEYCENGIISEDLYKTFMKEHSNLRYPDIEKANAFMRDFIDRYIKEHDLSWRCNRYLYGEAYGFKIFTEIDELPKNGHFGFVPFEIIKCER